MSLSCGAGVFAGVCGPLSVDYSLLAVHCKHFKIIITTIIIMIFYVLGILGRIIFLSNSMDTIKHGFDRNRKTNFGPNSK